MQGKKYIAAALVCGFILGSSTAPAQAGILGTVLKGGAIGVLVSQFDDQLNSAINTLTGKYAVSSDYATKVVPFGSFRAKALIPIDKVDITDVNRVQGVGVSAQIDVKL